MSEKDRVDKDTVLPYDAMLYQLCEEAGIKLEFLCTNWVRRLEKDCKVKFIVGRQTGLNSCAAGEIANDKVATYDVLKSREIPAVEHVILYEFANRAPYTMGRNSSKYVQDYFAKHNHHIVVKPINGKCGEGVMQINEEKQIMPTLLELFCKSPTVCMSPFYQVKHEYRMILLDSEVRVAYMKVLADKNQWKFNLCQGARTEAIPRGKVDILTALAKRAAKALGLRFCSVDMIETDAGETMVLEVNSGVMTDTYVQQHPEKYPEVRAMYQDMLRKMFEE